MLLFIATPVYHSDIMAPVVFEIYCIIYWHAGAGSHTRAVASGDYKAASCQNNKADALSSAHVWLAGTRFSWKESCFVHHQPRWLKKETKAGLGRVLEGDWARVQRVAKRSERSAHLPDLPPTLFCSPMMPLWRESSLIHGCCTSKCGLD